MHLSFGFRAREEDNSAPRNQVLLQRLIVGSKRPHHGRCVLQRSAFASGLQTCHTLGNAHHHANNGGEFRFRRGGIRREGEEGGKSQTRLLHCRNVENTELYEKAGVGDSLVRTRASDLVIERERARERAHTRASDLEMATANKMASAKPLPPRHMSDV